MTQDFSLCRQVGRLTSLDQQESLHLNVTMIGRRDFGKQIASVSHENHLMCRYFDSFSSFTLTCQCTEAAPKSIDWPPRRSNV